MGLETIALIAGAAVSAAGTGAAVYQGQKQARVAENAADDQAAAASRQRDELAEKQRQEEASTAAQSARSRQRLTGLQGKKGNILTTPLGIPEVSGYTGTTFLGGGQK